MIVHTGGWGFLAIVALFFVFVVVARALDPVIRPLALAMGLIGGAVGLIAGGLAFGAAMFALLARSAGWTGSPRWGVPGQSEPIVFALLGLCLVLIPLIASAMFARRRWRRKQG